jgi:hypothetical protein
MLTAEPGYGLESTMHGRQNDVEGVVGLRDDLKERGCHDDHYGTIWLRVGNGSSGGDEDRCLHDA